MGESAGQLLSTTVRKWGPFAAVVVFVLGWGILLYHYPPDELVDLIGVRNSYLVGFLVGVFGALSSFTTFSTYPAIVTLAAGDINPYLLGIVTGLGLSLGDVLFYYFGFTARGVVPEKYKSRLEDILTGLKGHSTFFIQVFVFVYVGFTPFPNNILTGSLAVIGYPVKRVLIPLILGDIFLITIASWMSSVGIDYFFN